MKKTLKPLIGLTLVLFNSSIIFSQNNPVQSQGNTQWKINGNIVDETNYIGTKNNFPLKFRSNDIERLRITPEGLIGIGTLLPQAQLDVYGNVIFRNNFSLPNLLTQNIVGNKDLILTDENGNLTRGNINQMLTEIYSPSRACRTDQNGDIPNPSWSNGLNKLYIGCPSVNVGINQENPRVKLDVNGISFSTRLALGFKDPLQLGNAYFAMKVPTNFSSPTKIFMIEGVDNTELFSVNNLGLISSKGFTGSYKLSTNLDEAINANVFYVENNVRRLVQIDNQGLLKARRIIVDQDEWPDYVFEPEYKLLPLGDLDKFIKLHKHLPDVPSQKEVETNGSDLGEMVNILLKKVEETNLYLIEQNKKIEQQTLEIELLKKELKLK